MANSSSSTSAWYRRAARCRHLAQQALQKDLGAESLQELHSLALDSDVAVREAALRALAAIAQSGCEADAVLGILVEVAVEHTEALRVLNAQMLGLASEGRRQQAATLGRGMLLKSEPEHLQVEDLTAALRLLGEVVSPPDNDLLNAVKLQCRSSEPAVRAAAIRALAAVANPGDESAIRLLASAEAEETVGSTRDPESQVRVAALVALSRLGGKHCTQARKAAVAAAEDFRSEVRAASAEALPMLCPQADPNTINVLCDLCSDRDVDVCCCALRSLKRLAPRPEGARPYAAVKACLDCFEQGPQDGQLHRLTLETAVALAGRNDPEVIKAVARSLESKDEEDWRTVSESFRIAADGDEELVSTQLVRRICDECRVVRRAAARCLQEVVPRGSDAAIQLLAGRAAAPNPDVRLDILDALSHVAHRGDMRATEAILERLGDAEARVRAAAVRALAKVAEKDDEHIITQIVLRLEDVEKSVRISVAEALPELAGRGNRKVHQCLAHCCRSQRPPPHRENIREAACWALARFAERGDIQAIEILGEAMDPHYPQATIGALKALLEVARRSDPAAIDVAAAALAHEDERTVDIAMEVLEQLADRGYAPPASSEAVTAFEGSWSGGVIKGDKIFWNCDDLVTPFELKSRSIISTVCADKTGRECPCWARLDACGTLRWDFGEEWIRAEDSASTSLPTLSHATMERRRELPAPQDAGVARDCFPDQGYPADPRPGTEEKLAVLEEHEVGDSYAVAAVAANFKSKDASVRRTAVRALPRVAGKGCKAAVEALLTRMEDESVDVRLAAVESLMAVSQKGDRSAIAALTVRLEDQECPKDSKTGQGVGLHAAKALKKLVNSREELVKIAKNLEFSGPSIRGF
eukprot:TRINITY_DN11310_c0_g1_i1.p1 TRINITY_DN11310_c0_g1~~TRINITY_DN11310_c0_g1_i1.p1  ORF type:complete len:873 (+),score=208.75 TRINITY_DN11310_c0_g1_i1:49-2667(+)